MFNFIKKLCAIRPHLDLARETLQTAELELLKAHAKLEYYNAVVPMYKARIARLKTLLGEV